MHSVFPILVLGFEQLLPLVGPEFPIMPMLCGTCGHHEETDEESCVKCGGVMRYSVLAGFEGLAESSHITLRGTTVPNFTDRVGQVVLGVIWACTLAVGFSFLAMIGVTAAGYVPEELPAEHPEIFHTLSFWISILAPLAAVIFQFRGVYLAQIVAGMVGFLAPVILCLAKLRIEIPIAWYEWLVPFMSAGICFAFGLRIAGRIQQVEEFKFKPINSWDKNVVPTHRELNPPVMRRWNRLIAGSVIGIILLYGLPSMIGSCLSMLVNNPSIVNAALARVDVLLWFVALLAAGMIAGSGTSWGFSQGILAGIFVFGMQQSFTPAGSKELLIIEGVMAIVICGIGGTVGRHIFKPFRMFGNARGVKPIVLPRTARSTAAANR